MQDIQSQATRTCLVTGYCTTQSCTVKGRLARRKRLPFEDHSVAYRPALPHHCGTELQESNRAGSWSTALRSCVICRALLGSFISHLSVIGQRAPPLRRRTSKAWATYSGAAAPVWPQDLSRRIPAMIGKTAAADLKGAPACAQPPGLRQSSAQYWNLGRHGLDLCAKEEYNEASANDSHLHVVMELHYYE